MGLTGALVTGIIGSAAVGMTVVTLPFVAPAFRKGDSTFAVLRLRFDICASENIPSHANVKMQKSNDRCKVCIPYVPASTNQIVNVKRLLERCPQPISPIVDLGSGDGRIFGEQLASHLTPEWRKQYIRYEELKAMLYQIMLEAPTDPDVREQYVSQADETFFAECERELTKINLFFSQKIAESQGKYHELNAELRTFKEAVNSRTPFTLRSGNVRNRFSNRPGTSSIQKEQSKTAQQLKLAFSEFYLNLVLVQNYQQLNGTGFRKILKKHDKLLMNEHGLDWRINRVEKSSFFLNRDIETLINNVETAVINELEGGNRQAGMKRLKVPPLSEKQHSATTFSLGFFMGIFVVLGAVIVFSWLGTQGRANEPKWVAVRLFRGFFLFFMSIWFCGLNMYGWAAAGVNHVLIFEMDPRNHLTYQTVMQLASFLLMLWALAVLGYLYAHVIYLPPFVFPLVLMLVCVIFLLNPFNKPENVFYRNSRFWLLKHCFNCFTAPFHFVTFTDFWLGDQMNSLATCFLDLQYFICFYATEVDYSGLQFNVRTLNITEGEVPWGYVDLNTGHDMCMSNSYIRVLVTVIPATVRFLQCLRRYRDTRRWHPHLVNAGKYATTYLVVVSNSINKWMNLYHTEYAFMSFVFWVFCYIISFTYTFLWDVFMDWGLIDPRAPKEAPFLREEMIYSSRWYYYFAIIEDFILRLSWVMNVSLAEAWMLNADLLTCIVAPLEVFRRFIWNYLRLENEHVNNCGQFRAVLECAKMGHEAEGIELNSALVLYSKFDAKRRGLSRTARFHRQNIFKTDMNRFNTSILFGAEQMVEFLVPKLNEMRPGSNLIMCRFPLPDEGTSWKLVDLEGEGIDLAWRYRKAAD
ncbi:hypothetical protein M3Y94_00322400 [Aphelenchoides besseyi]|nr:hypothetical protein M3Y94_00322400 [Aphelenchoides besseyi]